jgi:hypothetical protein
MAGEIGVMAIVAVALMAAFVHFSIHRIEEGHVGIYYRVSARSRLTRARVCRAARY